MEIIVKRYLAGMKKNWKQNNFLKDRQRNVIGDSTLYKLTAECI
jgi:hypothetical protein